MNGWFHPKGYQVSRSENSLASLLSRQNLRLNGLRESQNIIYGPKLFYCLIQPMIISIHLESCLESLDKPKAKVKEIFLSTKKKKNQLARMAAARMSQAGVKTVVNPEVTRCQKTVTDHCEHSPFDMLSFDPLLI